MEAVIEGLLYVQGDIGLTIKDIMNILDIEKCYYLGNSGRELSRMFCLKYRLKIVYENY